MSKTGAAIPAPKWGKWAKLPQPKATGTTPAPCRRKQACPPPNALIFAIGENFPGFHTEKDRRLLALLARNAALYECHMRDFVIQENAPTAIETRTTAPKGNKFTPEYFQKQISQRMNSAKAQQPRELSNEDKVSELQRLTDIRTMNCAKIISILKPYITRKEVGQLETLAADSLDTTALTMTFQVTFKAIVATLNKQFATEIPELQVAALKALRAFERANIKGLISQTEDVNARVMEILGELPSLTVLTEDLEEAKVGGGGLSSDDSDATDDTLPLEMFQQVPFSESNSKDQDALEHELCQIIKKALQIKLRDLNASENKSKVGDTLRANLKCIKEDGIGFFDVAVLGEDSSRFRSLKKRFNAIKDTFIKGKDVVLPLLYFDMGRIIDCSVSADV